MTYDCDIYLIFERTFVCQTLMIKLELNERLG